MFKKLPAIGLAALVAIALSLPAHATAARVKGKFKPEESGSVVLGSVRVNPMGAGVQRVGLRLQHVWRNDYTVYVATDQQAATLVPDCDLSAPSKEGSRRLCGLRHARRHAEHGVPRGAGEPDERVGDRQVASRRSTINVRCT